MDAMKQQKSISEKLFAKLQAGDVSALSYAIRAIENSEFESAEIYNRIKADIGRTAVIGFTGPPGVGKSTLINAYIDCIRSADQRVAVVAIDPSSPISGGAILGDRLRMAAHIDDPGVFIRSVSNRGHLGGLCAAISGIINLIDVAVWDVILLETVGAGQSDTDLTDIADIKVVIQAPGLGDDIQAIKAGILEIADVFVVNKADMPLADRAMRQLQAMIDLRDDKNNRVPIVKTVATEGVGVDLLKAEIDLRSQKWKVVDRQARVKKRMHRLFAREVGRLMERKLASMNQSEFSQVYEKLILGDLKLNLLVERMVEELQEILGD